MIVPVVKDPDHSGSKLVLLKTYKKVKPALQVLRKIQAFYSLEVV
jgi:hypothetical protein